MENRSQSQSANKSSESGPTKKQSLDSVGYQTPRLFQLGRLEKVQASHYSGDYKDSSGWWEYYA